MPAKTPVAEPHPGRGASARSFAGLATEAQYLKGVGPKNAALLAKLGLRTVGDVLYNLPRRYEDRRNIPKIGITRPGQFATIRGQLRDVSSRPISGGRVLLKARVSDQSGSVVLTWFNQPWIKRKLEKVHGEIVAYGQIKEASWGIEINNPEWELIEDEEDAEDFARIVPVYQLTEGLFQKNIRRAVRAAVEGYLRFVKDPLPEYLLETQGLRDLRWCLREVHMPTSDESRLDARRRLVFEEFLYLQLALAMRKSETQQESGISFPISRLVSGTRSAPGQPAAANVAKQKCGKQAVAASSLAGDEPLWDQIYTMLPFDLTGAQRRVIEEVWQDMERPHPMNRLVQGDVGSGKTAVAACAMLAAVRCGYQAALMAPTEILAEQHWTNLHRLFDPLGVHVALLVGKQTAREKEKQYAKVSDGAAQIAVGTHALIQEGVRFNRLGLVVIDEQHRFGVMQRAALRGKGLGNPDVLVMTATPIPRTLTMTIYGDLDISVIDEMPPGRRPVKTYQKLPFERHSVYEGVRKLMAEGRQAYFVCPMVSENEKMMAHAAEELYKRLSTQIYPELRIGLLHGQMKPKDKEEVMEQFRRHELDLLVSTTVIEVGVDVPNASVMVVEDANRFGLTQLHQLRGRVGRGGQQSYCVLIADAKNDEARARIEAMVATTDGFRIAEEDLRLRGPGELLGTRQSGNLDLKIADLIQDSRMLEVARQAAHEIITVDPKLSRAEHALMLPRVQERRTDKAALVMS